MSDTAAVAGLRAMRAELAKQADAITDEASRVGCTRFELRDTSGGFMLAPVLVAIAQIDVALLQLRPPTPVVSIDPGACACTELGMGPYEIAYACPVHGHTISRPCGVESYPGHPDTYVCALQAGHDGEHEGRGRSGGPSQIRWSRA